MAMISPLESANLLTELSAYAYTFTKSQRLTIIAISFVVAHVCNMAHEGLGHLVLGCMGLGYRPLVLTSSFARCSDDSYPFRFVSAAGTFMDLIMGMLFMGIFFIYRLRVPKTSWGTFYYVWWVAAYQCFLHGAGYMLSSPLLGWGDWDSALKDVPNALYYKIAVTVLGAVLSILALFVGFRTLMPMLGREPSYRVKRALWLCTVPYLVNCVILTAVSAIIGPVFIGTTAASSFGGTFLFGWLGPVAFFTRNNKPTAWIPDPPVSVRRSYIWMALGVLAFISHVFFAFGWPWMSGPETGWQFRLF